VQTANSVLMANADQPMFDSERISIFVLLGETCEFGRHTDVTKHAN